VPCSIRKTRLHLQCLPVESAHELRLRGHGKLFERDSRQRSTSRCDRACCAGASDSRRSNRKLGRASPEVRDLVRVHCSSTS
jgi:hypothetical protein